MYHLHLHGRRVRQASSTLKMEELRYSETWVNFYQTTRRHIPEDNTRHSNRCENNQSHNIEYIYIYIYIVARMWRQYNAGIGLTTGFIGSHAITHNYSVYTLTAHYSSLQHLPSHHTVSSLVSCLPISQDLFACNSSLKTAARPEYWLVTAAAPIEY
jgi:hypothetical protein